ncbi:MAG TPA: hypothetical protein VE988_05745 [Gemmataceae bacterium]|nr:hypothetical protein [Gemmataceae bacterium]
MKLVLFEDTNEQAQSLIAALKAKLHQNDSVQHFIPAGEDERIYDQRLIEALAADPYRDATLVIADRDLSKTPMFRGLSEPTVRRATAKLGIPECCYARSAIESDLIVAAEQPEACIAVSIQQGLDGCASQIIAVAKGFVEITERLGSEMDATGKKSPGRTLAGLMGKPEYADKIALYASGDQNRLTAVLEARGHGLEEQRRRLACLLGYWLWDSVLRFPGVIVDEVAASSYLNIDAAEFHNDVSIKALFESARYLGPFAGAKGDLWWRGVLDEIVASEESPHGQDFASKKLGRTIGQSKCCVDSTQAAGYYCMLSQKPVSLKNSKPGLPWFPRGADLARVSTPKFEELGPWL